MIWCVEDDASIRDIVVYTLESTGFAARGFVDGSQLWEALRTQTPELLLLDVMLPGEDGVTILRRLKDNPATAQLPVIMATAKGMEYDKIQSLDLGADDYLVKPFGMMEMVSRVKAVLRRCAAPSQKKNCGFVFNEQQRIVYADDVRLDLTYKEFELLRLLLSRPSVVFTREQIFAQVWEEDYMGESRTVDMHIRTLRQKLGAYGGRITTVRGVGYRWEENA